VDGTECAKKIRARRAASYDGWPNVKDGSSEIDHTTKVIVLQDQNELTKEEHHAGNSLLLHTSGVFEVKVISNPICSHLGHKLKA
jgi:hypothetical protein